MKLTPCYAFIHVRYVESKERGKMGEYQQEDVKKRKVLIINTGGTIGLKNTDQGTYFNSKEFIEHTRLRVMFVRLPPGSWILWKRSTFAHVALWPELQVLDFWKGRISYFWTDSVTVSSRRVYALAFSFVSRYSLSVYENIQWPKRLIASVTIANVTLVHYRFHGHSNVYIVVVEALQLNCYCIAGKFGE